MDITTTERTGECMEEFIKSALLDNMVRTCFGDKPRGSRAMLLQCFAILLNTVQEPLLIHQAIIIPLNAVLHHLMSVDLSEEEVQHFVDIAYEVALRFSKGSHLFPLFFTPHTRPSQQKSRPSPQDFLLFTCLLPHMMCAGETGRKCRDSILMCLKLTYTDPEVTQFVYHSTFAVALSASLKDVYDRLPKELDIDASARKNSSWSVVVSGAASPGAVMTHMIMFCNDVITIIHPSLVSKICKRIYSDFLAPCFTPAIHSSDDSNAQTAAVAYLEACVKRVTQPHLLCEFVRLIVYSTYEDHLKLLAKRDASEAQRLQNQPLTSYHSNLEALIEKLDSRSLPVAMATMNLFLTLLNLNCEDIVNELCLKGVFSICKSNIVASTAFVQQTSPRLIEAAEWFLTRRPVTTKSPCGLTFEGYIENARTQILLCSQATLCWQRSYTLDVVEPALPSTIAPTIDSTRADSSSSSSSGKALASSPSGEITIKQGFFSTLRRSVLTPSNATEVRPNIAPKFIRSLFNRFSKMMDQSLAHNLMITAIITRLALYSQPLLRTYLLDLSFSAALNMESPSLFDIIKELLAQVKAIEQEDGYQTVMAGIEQKGSSDQGLVDLPPSALSPTHSAMFRQQPLAADSSLSVSSSLWDTVPTAASPSNDLSALRSSFYRNPRPSSPTMSEISVADSIITVQESESSSKRSGGFMSWRNAFSFRSSAASAEPRPVKPATKPTMTTETTPERELEKSRLRKLRKSAYSVLVIHEFLKEMAAVCLEHAALLPR